MSSCPQKWYAIIDNHINLVETMFNFSINTVHADGLALLGATASDGIMMIQSGSQIYIYIQDWHLKG